MTPEQVIKDIEEYASEWLEMTPEPTSMLVGILAQKVVNLSSHVEYLERRLSDDARANLTRINS